MRTMSDTPKMPRYYAPELTRTGMPQPIGKPRPGMGTVYVTVLGTDGRKAPSLIWEATWIDEFEEPNEHQEAAGVERFEGDRAEVLAWVRAQPAAQRLMPDGQGWVPLPDRDEEVHIKGAS